MVNRNWELELDSTIFFCEFTMNSLWSHYETTMKHYETLSMNSLSASRIHYLFHEFILDPLSSSPNHYEFTICFANYLWIFYLLRDFSLNPLSFSRIRYLLRGFTLNLFYFRGVSINSLSFSWIHILFREFTIFFVFSLWIHYLFRDFTMNTLK